MVAKPRKEEQFHDANGRSVHQFVLDLQNIGLPVVSDKIIAMLESGRWQSFRDGLGEYHFLAGEFDYFLAQQGISRELVMQSVRDLAAKARLDEAMDERKTGADDYRRIVEDVRAHNPERPGQPIVPFGLTRSEASNLVKDGLATSVHGRSALGDGVRRYRANDGVVIKRESPPLVERLRRSTKRLTDDELTELENAIGAERLRRLEASPDSTIGDTFRTT